MSNLIPKSSSSKYPPVPIGDVSETDNSVKNMEDFEEQGQTHHLDNRRKSKQKQKKQRASRISRASRLSQLGNIANRPHRISLAESQQKNNYFQNGLTKTRCKGCGQTTQTILDHRPGCLAFTTCILLSPLGMGSCLLPFFIKSCLDMEQRCIQCEYIKRIRRAKCCQ